MPSEMSLQHQDGLAPGAGFAEEIIAEYCAAAHDSVLPIVGACREELFAPPNVCAGDRRSGAGRAGMKTLIAPARERQEEFPAGWIHPN